MERPIYDMLKSYGDRDPIRYHMPGHKGTWHPMDVTEIPQSDDLNHPAGAILRAQELLAKAYHATKSYFLVGGSTAGIKSMLLYTKMLGGGSVIIPRASHKAAFNACCMYGIQAIIAESEYDSEGIAHSDESITIKTMEQNPKASAVLVTRPDYYGRCMALKKIAQMAKELGMLLLVDEAHGAHYPFGELLPNGAQGYADMWVNSAHKTLTAATSGAYLHAGEGIEYRLLEEVLRTQRTSSPSFIIMMSLDDARCRAESSGLDWLIRAKGCEQLAGHLDDIEGIDVCGEEWAKGYHYPDKDITRMVVDVRHKGGGFQVAKRLYEDHRIQMEMADFYRIVGILTPWDQEDCDQYLIEALRDLPIEELSIDLPLWPTVGERMMPMHEAWAQAGQWVNADKAVGHVAATAVGCYPPGIPLALPGEVISQSVVDYLTRVEEAGGSAFGMIENKMRVVR